MIDIENAATAQYMRAREKANVSDFNKLKSTAVVAFKAIREKVQGTNGDKANFMFEVRFIVQYCVDRLYSLLGNVTEECFKEIF